MSLEEKIRVFIAGLTKEERAEIGGTELGLVAMEGLFSGVSASKSFNEGIFAGAPSSRKSFRICQHCSGTGRIAT